MKRVGALRIGTSGWSYAAWWGPFFPPSVKKAEALDYYTTQFDCVELNNPFYRTPTFEAVRGWSERTPTRFRFAWKASKFITHWKRLSEASRNSLDLMYSRLEPLGRKAGPVLFQLPPQMKADTGRLADFVAMLDPRWAYAFEFRHPSWYEPDVIELLRAHDLALCISDHADAPAPWLRTASFVYVRGHGPSGRYHGNYADETLGAWAASISRWRAEGADVWCFFDNDVKSAAPFDAARLKARMADEPKAKPAAASQSRRTLGKRR